MDVLRVVASSGPPGAHGHGHDGAGLHAVARLLRSGEDLLQRVYSRSRTAAAGRLRRCDEERLSQVDARPDPGTDATADRVLQEALQPVRSGGPFPQRKVPAVRAVRRLKRAALPVRFLSVAPGVITS